MSQLEEIALHFRNFAQTNPALLFLLLLLVAAFILLLLFWRRINVVFQTRRVVQTLFMNLARANRLTEEEQDLLLDMASYYRLGNPAILFVSPSRVRAYATRVEVRDRYRDPALLEERVQAVWNKLFAATS